AEYQAAFPQHADALRELKPTSRCPRCRKMVVLDEAHQARLCPDCDGASRSIDAAPPTEFDSRGYQLIETLGKGGMGEVYRSCDPALGRDLAIKVMKADLRGYPEAERRFLREARITGSLQHPSIVPVHNLGRLQDGRLHYTMRLVRGQTFADILKDEGGKPERLPALLGIFEKICQAVAYAHSKRVIHRDLKPANVMVGKFGEVQVMDLGLAKVLTIGADAEPRAPSDEVGTVIHTESVDTPSDLSRAGSGMGTAAYMPPEQALGEWDTVDERADVFALGSILCEMLTGQPAYSGTDGKEVFRRAKRGDLTEAGERLRQCPADATLIALCRECLSPERDGRPRDASVVAERVKDYQAAVQERLRQAELERVAAETRAKEEQARAVVEQERAREALARAAAEAERAQEAQARAKAEEDRTREALARVAAEMERTREALARAKAERRAKRRTLALAVVVFVLVAVGVAVAWRMQLDHDADQTRQDVARFAASTALEKACVRMEEGFRTNDDLKLEEAISQAKRAEEIADRGAGQSLRETVSDIKKKAYDRLSIIHANQRLLSDLVDIATLPETKFYREAGSSELVMPWAEPSIDEQFAAAFHRRWPDVDVDKQPKSEVAARLQEQPEVVLQGVISGLDAWMLERRRQQRPEAEWRRLFELVELLDRSEPRRQLRALLIGAEPPAAATVGGLLGGWPPWPALWELARGRDWRRLRQLRSQMDRANEPVLTVLLLAQTCNSIGDTAGAEEVLLLALARRPDEVALLDALGKVLERQGKLAEAIGFYRAVCAKHPNLGVSLALALGKAGKTAESVNVVRDLIRQHPTCPQILFYLGKTLEDQAKHSVDAASGKVIELKEDDALAFHYLGVVRNGQGKPLEAEAAFRKAISLQPDFAFAYVNLGLVLSGQGKHGEAEAAFRKAIAHNFSAQGKRVEAGTAYFKEIGIKLDFALAYSNLGDALNNPGKHAEAAAAYLKAMKSMGHNPNYASAYASLGLVLSGQGKHGEAEAAFRKAIALQPDFAAAYVYLGRVLNDQGKHEEAEAAFRKAIVLQPDFALAYANLGRVLSDQGKHGEAEAASRKAIALMANFVEAYNNVTTEMYGQWRHAVAESLFLKAFVRYLENYAEAYNNLGKALYGQGKHAEAEAAYLKAMVHHPDYAEAHCNLGEILVGQGRFTEALASYQRGHELGSKQPGWRYPSLQWVRNAERMVGLEKKLPAVLQGEASPANADDVTTLAWMCRQSYQKRYAASARLYAGAFSAEPKLAADLDQQHRYSAACSAALAAAGQGEDARLLPDKTVAMFRRWALGWLRDDLTAYAKLAQQNKPAANQMIQQRMPHWRRDTDLASVRDPQALNRLPEIERAAWQALWRDVDELAKRVAKQDKAGGKREKREDAKPPKKDSHK
ncbi:MAG: tetratricopeptide repeat protein, partial [Gemmataceae bacterium]